MESKAVRTGGTLLGFVSLWILALTGPLRGLPFEEVFWLSALYVLCFLPTLIFLRGHRFRIPLAPMWGLGYFAMFGMPLLSADDPSVELAFYSPAEIGHALRLVVLGAALLLAFLYLPVGAWVETLIPRRAYPWDEQRAARMGVFLTLTGLGFFHYSLSSIAVLGVQQILFIASQLHVIGELTLFLLQLRGKLSRSLKLFLWGFAVPAQFFLGLGTGSVWQVIRSLSPFLFCYSAERRRIPWKGLAVLILCVVPFLGVKQEYRSYAWGSEMSEDVQITANPLQRGLAFLELTFLRMKEGGVEMYTVAAETAEARVNHLELLSIVTEMTPSLIPFWGGETYQTFFWALVPRFLFPSKPTKTLGQDFGHRYELLHEEDESTSFNLPHQVVEMYINFGTAGIVVGMILVGLAYRAVLVFLGQPKSGERALIIGCALLANLLSLDSDFSLVFGGVVQYLLLMLLFTRFLKPRREMRPA